MKTRRSYGDEEVAQRMSELVCPICSRRIGAFGCKPYQQPVDSWASELFLVRRQRELGWKPSDEEIADFEREMLKLDKGRSR